MAKEFILSVIGLFMILATVAYIEKQDKKYKEGKQWKKKK